MNTIFWIIVMVALMVIFVKYIIPRLGSGG